MQSIEVVSDTEYNARIHVKLAFISAKFKIKRSRPANTAHVSVQVESTGEDASVASSLKSVTELFLTEHSPENTGIARQGQGGFVGSLGFAGHECHEERQRQTACGTSLARTSLHNSIRLHPKPQQWKSQQHLRPRILQAPPRPPQPLDHDAPPRCARVNTSQRTSQSWWQRLFAPRATNVIQVDIRRGDTSISIQWPESSAKECAAWLQDYLKQI